MKNNRILIAIFLIFSLYSVSALEYTENSEKSCDINGLCTTTIYSYQKYYQDNNQWKQIDENFGAQNCQPGYNYCVDGNLYQFHAKNTFGDVLVTYGASRLSFSLASLASNTPLASSVISMEENTITYANVMPYIDVRYTYLPHKVKEDIIIKERTALASLTNDLNLEFTLDTHGSPVISNSNLAKIGDLYITDLVAYDNKSKAIRIPFTLTDNTLRMTIPIAWLKNETRQYPIIIDPTIQTNLSVVEDLTLNYDENIPPIPLYSRTDSTTRIDVGYYDDSTPPAIGIASYRRGYLLWDISSIPDSATITDINMTLRVGQIGDATNWNVTVTSMDGNFTTYPDNTTSSPCMGNCHFFIDIGNGTNYTISFANAVGKQYFNLFNATTDLANALSKNTFGVGLYVKGDTDKIEMNEPATELRIYSPSEASNPNFRPVLYVTYSVAGANEDEADAAIEESITSALPLATLHPEQQIYTRSSSGVQQLGRFDRVAAYTNQRWAINYITSGESFTNMNNISRTFFVLELQDLFASDIANQVQAFINTTKV